MVANIFTPCNYNNHTKFFKIFLKRIPEMYTFTYLTLFTFKVEPTEVQDAAKKPNFEF